MTKLIGFVRSFRIEQEGWGTHTKSHLTLCEGLKTDCSAHVQGRGFLCGTGDVGEDIRFITVFIRVSRDERKSLCIRTSRCALRFTAFIKVKWSCREEKAWSRKWLNICRKEPSGKMNCFTNWYKVAVLYFQKRKCFILMTRGGLNITVADPRFCRQCGILCSWGTPIADVSSKVYQNEQNLRGKGRKHMCSAHPYTPLPHIRQ